MQNVMLFHDIFHFLSFFMTFKTYMTNGCAVTLRNFDIAVYAYCKYAISPHPRSYPRLLSPSKSSNSSISPYLSISLIPSISTNPIHIDITRSIRFIVGSGGPSLTHPICVIVGSGGPSLNLPPISTKSQLVWNYQLFNCSYLQC